MTELDTTAPSAATSQLRKAAVTAGWYAMVAAAVLNVPVFVGAVLMAGLGLTWNEGPWWAWVKSIPFALLMLAVPAALLAGFLWLVRRLLAGKPSLWLSGGLALIGGSIWFGVY